MPFDHKHYVPILKGKRAEFNSLDSLKSKDGITPLLESIPSVSADSVPCGMAKWPKGQAYFIDLLFFDDSDDPTATAEAVKKCFGKAIKAGHQAIPVSGLSRSPAYQNAAKLVVDAQHNGLALRLTPDDFEDLDELEAALNAACKLFGLPKNQIDLVLDLGAVGSATAGTVAQMHRANIDLLPDTGKWRTLTVAASAFPLSLMPLQRDHWNVQQRKDWRGWSQIVTGAKRPARLPAFGDYAIAHPELPPEGQATILAQLRYATPDSWLIWKGRNAIQQGYDQFLQICANLVNRSEFRGSRFSWGDSEIAKKAANGGSPPGNAQTWRQIGTSHHLETVLEQIANLP